MGLVSFTILAAFLYRSLVYGATSPTSLPTRLNSPVRSSCENSPMSRPCWGLYSTNTDYYSETPNTGITREYWLSVENTTLAPDGYERQVLTYNGTIPGPAIVANWGDNLVVHVTNNLENNGTSVHWHGMRMLNTNEYDGVPGVTQCPIAPGESYTYRFRATQYGSTWFHSHFSLQYSDGLYGPLIINGPATANYDEDLGLLFLSDWSHKPIAELWDTVRKKGAPSLENGLINGTNTYDCSASTDPKCVGNGKKFERTFEAGRKYRIGLVNVATNGHFQFSIDAHNLTVISNDLVPIVPYQASSVLLNIGQRYDVVVEANAEPGDYWLRGGWQSSCSPNDNAENITGIIRYSATSTADPTTTGIKVGDDCGDEPLASLVPYLALDVGSYEGIVEETVGIVFNNYLLWTINSSSLYLNWSDPTNLRVYNHESVFPTDYNILSVEKEDSDDEWEVLVLEEKSGIPSAHPIHLHGHDFWVLAQGTGDFSCSNTSLSLNNPPRRDTATLPGGGYLAIAFKKDNPGSWLMHCHISWHSSQGFALQVVEFEKEIASEITHSEDLTGLCKTWDAYTPTEMYIQDDSGV